MTTDRELTTTYVILGQAHIAANSYDAKDAFVLLHSIRAGLGDAAPNFVDFASHLHMIAALGGNEAAKRDAQRAMARVIGALERTLTRGASAGAQSKPSP